MFAQVSSEKQVALKRRITLQFAQSEDDVREAQRLRYRIFAEEMGARLDNAEPGIDRDMYDPYCEHLMVRDVDTQEVVGTYRILSPSQAKVLGGYYSDEEFDLTRLTHLRQRMVEVGRSCVHPDYRNGATILMLWSGLISYMRRNNYEYMVGCASISMADGGHMAASVYRRLRERHLSPPEWRVFPRCALPLEALNNQLDVAIPPLLKGYMRVGCYVCGEPAWDPDFNTADVLVLLPMDKLTGLYDRHFQQNA